MTNYELAMRRIEQGYKVKFYQDYYGRQWVKVNGGAMFWRTRAIPLRNEEVISLKASIARRREISAAVPVQPVQPAKAA